MKIVGGTRTSLMVNQPACIVRFCRRAERRFTVPAGELPRIALPLAEDPITDDALGPPALPAPVALHLRTARHDGLMGNGMSQPARAPAQAPRERPTHVIMHR